MLNILEVADVGWNGVDKIKVENYEFAYFANDNHTGVGILMREGVTKCLMGYWAVYNRVVKA